MNWDNVADGCASAGCNEDFLPARGNGARKRFAAPGVPTLCVQSVCVSTGFSAYGWDIYVADGAILARGATAGSLGMLVRSIDGEYQ